MGADLITRICVGPLQIGGENGNPTTSDGVRHATRRHAELIETAEDLLIDPSLEDAALKFPDPEGARRAADRFDGAFESVVELKEAPESIDWTEEVLTNGGVHPELCFMEESEIEDLAGRFVDFWNGDYVYRNSNRRIFPAGSDKEEGQKIVVAGERTWGTPPQGAFRLLEIADNLGLLNFFGVR